MPVTTRARLVSLVIAASLALSGFSLYIVKDQRTLAESRARRDVHQYAQLMSALVSGMDVSDLATLDPLELGRGETLTILDQSGRVLLRVPAVSDDAAEWHEPALLEAGRTAGESVVERRDARGEPRLYAFRRTVMRGDSAVVMVAAGVKLAVVHGESRRLLLQSLSGIGFLTLVLLLLAWFGTQRLVLRPIQTLLAMSAKVRSGDFAARTGMRASREELSQLGSALDRMAEQLERRDARLNETLEKLRALSVTDALTGLYNRRYFWDALEREFIAARRNPAAFSVILIDLDHFKRVNDEWGHEAGDRVLQAASDLLRRHIRGSDFAVRYGGEEFAVLLPGTGVAVAEERADQLRMAMEALEIPCDGGRITITLSAGVAESAAAGDDGRDLMKRADDALYAAKTGGRNRVVRAAARGRTRSKHPGSSRGRP